jgi:hypothetical protein
MKFQQQQQNPLTANQIIPVPQAPFGQGFLNAAQLLANL